MRWWKPKKSWQDVGIQVGCFVLGIVAVMVATTITGFVNDPDALEPGEIVVLSGRDDSIDGQRRALISEWNDLNPENQARIVELSGQADGQRSEMLARAQSGAGEVDVYNLDVTWTAEFADGGYISSLDPSRFDPAGFLDKPLATCRFEGRLWALPFNTDVGLLYYRADLVPEPPRSWEDLENAVRTERERGGPDGYVAQLAEYEGLTVNALEAVRGAGGAVVDETGNVVVDEAGDGVTGVGFDVTRGLERLREVSPNGLPALDEAGSIEYFRSGKGLFMRNWPVAQRALTENPEGPQTGEIKVAELPGGGALGGQNLAVAADSARPRAAQALIRFLTSDRSQQILLERGGLPATRAVVYADLRESSPFVKTLEAALKGAVPRPVLPHYARFSEVFRTAVDGYLRRDGQLPGDLQEQLQAAVKGKLPPSR